MRSLSASELLAVWERGQGQGTLHRALLLVFAAHPENSLPEIATWSIGARNAALLELRRRTFGNEIASQARCPVCGTALEIVQDTRAFLATESATNAAPLELRVNGYHLPYRLPNTNDLLAVADVSDVLVAQTMLLERLVESPGPSVQELVAHQHAPALIEQLDAAIADADPLASIQLALTCPQCGNQWHAALDIADFFWTEIHAWALRTLHEIHTIASAYGWSEDEILALTPQRRQLYLELIGS